MRIIGGRWRGKELAGLGKGDPAAHLRPTSDRVRESLFNILEGGRFGDPVDGAVVLDLFAGTGALGLEALSRGAARAAFVDNGRTAQTLLRKNIDRLGAAPQATLSRMDATRIAPPDAAEYSLVFLDPPYGGGLGEKALSALRAAGGPAPGALVVWEETRPPQIPSWLRQEDQRRYGDTVITFLRVADE